MRATRQTKSKRTASVSYSPEVSQMSTTQTTPAPSDGVKPIEVSRSVFDLDRKEYVEVKKVGSFRPVTSMEEFVSRLGNDALKILEIANDGLEEFERKALSGADSPWLEEDETTHELKPFSGTQISTDKAKQLQATVLNMAKMLFGYDEASKIQDAEKRVAAKNAAKASALQMILSNPAAVEGLKG